MAAGLDGGRERRAGDVRKILHRALVIESVHPTLLAEDAARLAALAADALAHQHPRRAPLGRFEQGDLVGERIVVLIGAGLVRLEARVGARARDGSERLVGHADIVGRRVGGVPQGDAADAPILVRPDLVRVEVIVLPFGVDQLAEAAGLVDFAHRVEVGVETGSLHHHVLQAARLDGLVEPVGVFQGTPDGGNGAGDVLAVLEDIDRLPGVAGGVGGQEDRLDLVVLDHFLQRRIGLFAAADLGQFGAAIGKQVADGNHLDVGMVLETEGGAETAGAVADDADANLAVRDGLPFLGCLGVGGLLLEALDLGFLLGGSGAAQSDGRGAKAHGLKERTS